MGLLSRLRGDRAGTTLAAPRPDLEAAPPLGRALGTLDGPVSQYLQGLKENAPAYNPSDVDVATLLRMRRDYTVASCLTVRALPIMRADYVIESDDEDVATFTRAAFAKIWPRLARSATRQLWAGYSPNVLVWDVDPVLGGIVVTEVRDLPPETCQPLLEPGTGRYVGLIQHRGTSLEARVPGPQTLWLVEGFESGNYFGRSPLVAAYDPWYLKQHAALYHAHYLERFGEPVVKMRAPEGTYVESVNPDGTPATYGDNLERAEAIGTNLRHHSVLTLPSSVAYTADGKSAGWAWDAEYLVASGSGADGGKNFREAIADADRAMSRAMLIPDLLLTQGEHGAYSLSSTHRDVFTLVTEGCLDETAGFLNPYLLEPLVRYNFGPNAPPARLTFAPQADEDRDRLWEAAVTLIEKGALPLDLVALAERVGVPYLPPSDDPDNAAAEQASAAAVSTVGVPALIDAGVISADEGRALIGIGGSAPGAPQVAADRDRDVIHLRAGDASSLPEWQRPQAIDPPSRFRRALTPREARIDLARVEDGLNAAEARTIRQVETVLETMRTRTLRQVKGVLGKTNPAEVIAAISTIDPGGLAELGAAWRALMADVWAIALESVRTEVGVAYAANVPQSIGATGNAVVRTLTTTSAERVLTSLATEIRLEVLNALRSSVSPAGIAAVVSRGFDALLTSEAKGPRLTTRLLASRALNEGRADAITRGGVPIRAAQYSAILDRRTCDLCATLDERVISVAHTDYARLTPPLHHGCRCVWVYITEDEEGVEETWTSPAKGLTDRYGGLVF